MAENASNPVPTNGSARTEAEEPLMPRGLRGTPRPPNRIFAFARGWSRNHLSHDNLVVFGKTLLWVGPLTILIWIYAERQQQFQLDNVSLPIEVVSSDPSKVARIEFPADKNVMVTLIGPKSAIDGIRDRTNPLDGSSPVRIRVDTSSGGESQTIDAVRIGEDRRFSDVGITVKSAQPGKIRVLIDPIVTEAIPVQADIRLLKAPVFTPAVVSIRGPRSVLRELQKSSAGGLFATAQVAKLLAGAEATSGADVDLVNVKVVLPFKSDEITLLQETVSARVEPVRPEEYTIPFVRVVVAAPQNVINGYRIEVPNDGAINNVKVSGPLDQIQRLIGTSPRATVEIPADFTSGDIDAPVRYELPEGVTVKDGVKVLRIHLTPR